MSAQVGIVYLYIDNNCILYSCCWQTYSEGQLISQSSLFRKNSTTLAEETGEEVLLLDLPGVVPVVVRLALFLIGELQHHDYHEQTVCQEPSCPAAFFVIRK